MADIVECSNSSDWMNCHPMPCDEMQPESPVEAGRTDRSLLRRLRSGEQDAATALYLRYAKRLQAVAKAQTSATLATRFDPEDVVQSVFRTFFRRASEGQYDVPEGEELWNLLLVISLNKIRALAAFHKAAKRDVTSTVDIAAAESHGSSSGASLGEALRVLEMIVEEFLSDLPDAQRDMIRMRIEGHGVTEIVESTRRSKRSVERVLQQFRSRLSGLLFEDAGSDDAH